MDGFYDKTFQILTDMKAAGLLYLEPDELVAMAGTPAEAVKITEQLVAEARAKTAALGGAEDAATAMGQGNIQATHVRRLKIAAGIGCVGAVASRSPAGVGLGCFGLGVLVAGKNDEEACVNAALGVASLFWATALFAVVMAKANA